MKTLLAVCLFLAPTIAQAACTNDLPGTGVLNFHPDATSTGSIGGIGPNQCGIEVTDFCKAGRCLAFFEGLSGYIDVTGLESGTIDAAPTEFTYTVAGAEGQTVIAGELKPFRWDGPAPLRVALAADHVMLMMPPPFDQAVRLDSTGSSGWEGVMPDWVGVPVPVVMYLDRLGADDATMEIFTESDLIRLNVILALQRQMAPPAPATLEATDACARAEALARQVGSTGQQDLVDAYYTAVARAGIADWERRNETQCRELLRHLDAMDIRAETLSTPPAADVESDCVILAKTLRPILRGPASDQKSAAFQAMITAGVTSVDNATPAQCAAIAAALGL